MCILLYELCLFVVLCQKKPVMGIELIMSSWVYGYLGQDGMCIAQLIRVNSTDARLLAP